MVISRQLMKDLVKVLKPLMDTPKNRQGYLFRVLGTESPLFDLLVWDGSVNEFIPNLVNKLVNFDKLCALLELIREEVGEDVKKRINGLLQQIIIQQQLTDIFAPLEQKQEILQVMKKAYVDCCPRNWGEDWEDESPDSLEKILSNLGDMPQGNAHESPIVQFVARLSQNPKIPQPIVDDLEKWLQQNVNNCSDLLNQNKNPQVSRQESQNSISTYLIISLKASLQKRNSYNLKAWFIPNGAKGEFNCSTGEGCVPLESIIQQSITLKAISALFNSLIEELNTKYKHKVLPKPSILFFLPLKLLNHPIDSEKYKNSKIGSVFHVVLRNTERLNNSYFNKNDWHEKWQKIQFKDSKMKDYKIIVAEDCEMLFANLKKNETLGLVSMKVLSKEIIDHLDATATPVAIWLRDTPKNLKNCQDKLNELLEGEIHQLPELVTQKRAEAVDIPNPDDHIGHHLSLLWEDPNLFLPEIDYTAP